MKKEGQGWVSNPGLHHHVYFRGTRCTLTFDPAEEWRATTKGVCFTEVKGANLQHKDLQIQILQGKLCIVHISTLKVHSADL